MIKFFLRFESDLRQDSGFICPMSANVYGIDFQAFTIRDHTTDKVIFKVQKPEKMPKLPRGFDTDKLRMIEYKFPRSFVECKTVATSYVHFVFPPPSLLCP